VAESAETAQQFLDRTERRLLELSIDAQQADWVYATFITQDTQALSSRAYSRLLSATAEAAREAARFGPAPLDETSRRKLRAIPLSLPLLAPKDPAEGEELPRLITDMQATYAKGRHQPAGATEPLPLEGLEKILATNREPQQLQDVWVGWHRVAPPMRPSFERYVELANRGAREFGFGDLGEMWRSKYDMPPEAFAHEVERLWQQVAPLYAKLLEYVRRRLRNFYGPDLVPERGPIPAHLFGNMWAQSWENLMPILAPGKSEPEFDLTQVLVARGTDARGMVQFAERFFVSLGLDPLPASFWERSMFVRPRDRDVVCHASAWDIDTVNDLRIKMCIDITAEDFRVIHHELGHNYYQRECARQPFLFRDGAHDGFHEAIGDTIALSVTPEYLRSIGLIDRVPPPENDIAQLLERALEKVAFFPFGLLVDRWRWDVFSGKVGPDSYNRHWWELREKYQQVRPPIPRTEADFDPGAKFHVPANVPYMRYFLAGILQFQFHRGLARAAGWDGPLHRCSIYGNRVAGARFKEMLGLGASRAWPEALEALTGERAMDAAALREYFEPLESWLDRENAAGAR
jgi:peptidyl-dipeptidase A